MINNFRGTHLSAVEKFQIEIPGSLRDEPFPDHSKGFLQSKFSGTIEKIKRGKLPLFE